MARGKNPDGTPKRWPADDKRKASNRKINPYAEAIVNGDTLSRDTTPSMKAWTSNPAIVRRLEMVERGRLAGMSAYETSQATGMPISTVLEDWQRLNDLWVARVSKAQEQLRGEAVRRLDNVIRNGLELLRMDEVYTQAVLFNIPVMIRCTGRQEHRTAEMPLNDPLGMANPNTAWGEVFSCTGPHEMLKRVFHDAKGSAQYRRIAGQVLQAINVAIMNQARIQGLVVEKKALTDVEGKDLPAALRTILLGEDVPDMSALPEASESVDIGLT